MKEETTWEKQIRGLGLFDQEMGHCEKDLVRFLQCFCFSRFTHENERVLRIEKSESYYVSDLI